MELTLAYFQPLLGREFEARLTTGAHTSRLVLTAVEVLRPPDTNRPIRKDPFSLAFRGPVQGNVAHVLVYLSLVGAEGSALFTLEPMGIVDGLVEYLAVVA